MKLSGLILAASIALLATSALADPADGPYKVVNTVKVGGVGNWDYVYADSAGRRLYIPRTGRGTARVTVFDLDTLKPVGEIPNTTGVHGVAVDTKSGHGFASSNPVVMFDAKTLAPIKTIQVQGRPDGILFDPATQRVFVFSHRAPNVTAINAADGSIAGTIDLGGSPEQAVSDGAGHLYVDIEDGDKIAVVDANGLKMTASYDISSKGGGPGGLAIDVKNHILFAFCHDPQTAVILSADDGKIITSLPIGDGVDSAVFNPNTMEAFSSQGDGTLTVIKENSPASFEVEQNVPTKQGARTCTLDARSNQIFLITADFLAPAPTTQPSAAATGGGGGRRERARMAPDSFMILVVSK